MYSQASIFQFEVIREDRYVWRMLLENNEFEKAKQFCKVRNKKCTYSRIRVHRLCFFQLSMHYIESIIYHGMLHRSIEHTF